MNTPVLSRAQSRAVDAIAIKRYGFSGLVLMENAGRGIVDELLDIDPTLAAPSADSIAILCGKGNNAGDGFVIARHLEIRGVEAKVVLLASPEELIGDARANFDILKNCSVPIVDLSMASDLKPALSAEAAGAAWLIDAMLGTGATGAPREPIATAIQWMNAQAAKRLAIDVPSGLDCDTGQPSKSTVQADCTCTFVAVKRGYLQNSASEYLGDLRIVSIGIPPSLIDEVTRTDSPA